MDGNPLALISSTRMLTSQVQIRSKLLVPPASGAG